MEAKGIIIGVLLVALFSIAFISFGINFGLEREAEINIANDSRINVLYTNLNDSIYNYDDSGDTIQETANGTTSAFNQDDTTGSSIISDFIISSIVGVGKTLMGVVMVVSDIILDPVLSLVLPAAPEVRRIVGIILATILMFVLVLITWRLIKVGY